MQKETAVICPWLDLGQSREKSKKEKNSLPLKSLNRNPQNTEVWDMNLYYVTQNSKLKFSLKSFLVDNSPRCLIEANANSLWRNTAYIYLKEFL